MMIRNPYQQLQEKNDIDNNEEEEALNGYINDFWFYLEVPIYLILLALLILSFINDDGTIKKRPKIFGLMLFFQLQWIIVYVLTGILTNLLFFSLWLCRERVVAYQIYEASPQIAVFFHILTIGGASFYSAKLLFFSPDITNIYAVVYLVVVLVFSGLLFLKHLTLFFFLRERPLKQQFIVVDGRVVKVSRGKLDKAKKDVEDRLGLLEKAKMVDENDELNFSDLSIAFE